MIIFLFILMMLDYALTMVGLNLGIITEGNILMLWCVQLPWQVGSIVKAIISIVLLIPIYIAKRQELPLYKIAVVIILGVYILLFMMHTYWIFMYMGVYCG